MELMEPIIQAREERQRENNEIIKLAASEVTKFRPHIPTGVRLTLITGFASPPQSGLGAFQKLPVELVQEIVSLLDVQTCFRLRHVNRLFRAMVTDTPEYKTVAANASAMLQKVFHVGLAPQLGISKLQEAILSTECMDCGHDGSHVYLLTMTRHCEDCSHDSHFTTLRSHTVSLSSVAKAAHMSCKTLSEMVPVAQLRPGRDSYPAIHRQIRLVNQQEAVAIVRRHRGENYDLDRIKSGQYQFPLVCTFAPFFDKTNSQWYLPLTCKGCHGDLIDDIRAVAEKRKRHDWDFRSLLEDKANRQFSRAGFLAHFATCSSAQRQLRHLRRL